MNKIVVEGAGSLIYSSSDGILAESNYEIFKSGVAGNLLLIEGMLSQSPKNLDLLATLNKGYVGYAFAINETQMYQEEWAEENSEEGKKQALLNYTRALNFGIRYLAEKKIAFSDILLLMNDGKKITALFDKNLNQNKRDQEIVLFTAQAFAALINLQKDNIGLVSQLPAAKKMFDWVCLKNPSINFGTCDIFYGAYEAGRPPMLGGNPKKGKELFQKAIAKFPYNWLIRTSYLQFYLIPQNEESGFKEQMEVLKKYHDDFNKHYIYDHREKPNALWLQESGVRFYQTLSLKRYELMSRFKKHFF